MNSKRKNWNLIDWILWTAMWLVIGLFGAASAAHFLGIQAENPTSQTSTNSVNWK